MITIKTNLWKYKSTNENEIIDYIKDNKTNIKSRISYYIDNNLIWKYKTWMLLNKLF